MVFDRAVGVSRLFPLAPPPLTVSHGVKMLNENANVMHDRGYGAAEWRNRIEYDTAWTKETTTTDEEKTTWTFAGGADGKGTMINGAVQTKPEDLAKILAAPSGGLGPYLGWA